METAGHNSKRPVVVDFLVTLFIIFCIGAVASLTLVGSVLLMAGDARGEERCADATRAGAPEEEMLAKLSDLALAHHLATKYTNLVAVERAPARPAADRNALAPIVDAKAVRPRQTEGAQHCLVPDVPGSPKSPR